MTGEKAVAALAAAAFALALEVALPVVARLVPWL
jgi:hypothetical protein